MLVGIVNIILWTSKGETGRWKLTKKEESFLMHIVTNKVVKMKKHLPFFRKFRIFSIESEVAVVMLPKFDIESALKNSTFWWVVC